jgi:hypothetical protein
MPPHPGPDEESPQRIKEPTDDQAIGEIVDHRPVEEVAHDAEVVTGLGQLLPYQHRGFFILPSLARPRSQAGEFRQRLLHGPTHQRADDPVSEQVA